MDGSALLCLNKICEFRSFNDKFKSTKSKESFKFTGECDRDLVKGSFLALVGRGREADRWSDKKVPLLFSSHSMSLSSVLLVSEMGDFSAGLCCTMSLPYILSWCREYQWFPLVLPLGFRMKLVDLDISLVIALGETFLLSPPMEGVLGFFCIIPPRLVVRWRARALERSTEPVSDLKFLYFDIFVLLAVVRDWSGLLCT